MKLDMRTFAVALAAAAVTVACSDVATSPTKVAPAAPSFTNGFPDNGHATLYKMNLIGVPKGKTATMDGDQGKRIFINLDGNTKIWLQEGATFDIIDANGTDSDGAKFQLPNPLDSVGAAGIYTKYSVWVRVKGKPGGSMNMTTCAIDTADGLWCSTDTVTVTRSKGKPSVTNVTKELLTVCIDLDGNGTCDRRVALFDDRYQDYYWSFDNTGLKNAEVRFLDISGGPFSAPSY